MGAGTGTGSSEKGIDGKSLEKFCELGTEDILVGNRGNNVKEGLGNLNLKKGERIIVYSSQSPYSQDMENIYVENMGRFDTISSDLLSLNTSAGVNSKGEFLDLRMDDLTSVFYERIVALYREDFDEGYNFDVEGNLIQ
tara:strand:+ start:291 stop:707 length:417 start_codon:yes stop_codon:yes gene_type:complete